MALHSGQGLIAGAIEQGEYPISLGVIERSSGAEVTFGRSTGRTHGRNGMTLIVVKRGVLDLAVSRHRAERCFPRADGRS